MPRTRRFQTRAPQKDLSERKSVQTIPEIVDQAKWLVEELEDLSKKDSHKSQKASDYEAIAEMMHQVADSLSESCSVDRVRVPLSEDCNAWRLLVIEILGWKGEGPFTSRQLIDHIKRLRIDKRYNYPQGFLDACTQSAHAVSHLLMQMTRYSIPQCPWYWSRDNVDRNGVTNWRIRRDKSFQVPHSNGVVQSFPEAS